MPDLFSALVFLVAYGGMLLLAYGLLRLGQWIRDTLERARLERLRRATRNPRAWS